jgi:hypothetical protein
MSDLSRINGRLSLRDFISAVRDCKAGRHVSKRGVLRPVTATSPTVGQLGPSLDDFAAALRRALGHDSMREVRAGGRDARDEDVAASEEDAFEVFDGPAFTTFYGVGDSEQGSSDGEGRRPQRPGVEPKDEGRKSLGSTNL